MTSNTMISNTTNSITNHYDNLLPLEYGNSNFIQLTEKIDTDKLSFIINKKSIFEPLLREDRRFKGKEYEHYDAFMMASKFLKKSRNGHVKVLYNQKRNIGRYYAVKSLSLQCITRQIRQTICNDYYLDIDMKNCHPTILKFICDECGISCPILSRYVSDRKKFFKKNNVTKSVGKITLLSIINGGKIAYKKLKNPSEELQEFYNTEIKNIHNNIALKHHDKFIKHKEERIANDKNHNHKASFMNIILCDIENKILQEMYNFFGKPSSCVLCFDGIMLEKGHKYDIQGAEQQIFDKFNINIKLDIKPFEDAFDLTKYGKLPEYNEMSLEYYSDFRNLIGHDVYPELIKEWTDKSLVLIENGGKSFFLTKNRMVDCLTKEIRVYYKQVQSADILNNLKVKLNVINPKFDFIFLKDFMSKKPKEKKELLQIMNDDQKSKLIKYLYKWIGPHGQKNEPGYIQDIMENRLLNSYNNIEFYPYLSRNGKPKLDDSFNTFTGFPLEKVSITKTIDFEKSHLYKHIKEEMMNNNVEEFEHFLDHISDMIQDPCHIKTNGHLFYTKQGMGKGMLAEFVTKLLGSDHTISFENTEAYFGKFNADQSNKLLKIFEEVSDKGSAFSNHDRLKGDQSKKMERVEPKGIDPYTIRHCSRFWFLRIMKMLFL